jgi:hypothetical protein
MVSPDCRRKSLSVCLFTVFLVVSGGRWAVAEQEYPSGPVGQEIRDKIALARQQADRFRRGPAAIDKPYTLSPDREMSEQSQRTMHKQDEEVMRADLADGSTYFFCYAQWSGDKVVTDASYRDATKRSGFQIRYGKGIIREAFFWRDGKWDGLVYFHRPGDVAEAYELCNKDGDIVRRLKWNEQGKLIGDETPEKPIVVLLPASKEDEERVKAALIEHEKKLREEAAKRPVPTPKPLTPVEEARKYARTRGRDPDVAIGKFQTLIDTNPDNPENFFHEVDIISILLAPGAEKWQLEKRRPAEAVARIRQVIQKYPMHQNNIQMLFLRCYLAMEVADLQDYATAAEQYNLVLDFPQEKIVVSPPAFAQFPLPPGKAEHLKTEHPAQFKELERKWKGAIHLLRRTAAGSYAVLEYDRGGLPALEQLATQRPGDPDFQEKVRRSLDFRRKELSESAKQRLGSVVQDTKVEPAKR